MNVRTLSKGLVLRTRPHTGILLSVDGTLDTWFSGGYYGIVDQRRCREEIILALSFRRACCRMHLRCFDMEFWGLDWDVGL
jgi:hypothetical protein